MIRGSGCSTCPAKEECRAQIYRGVMCIDQRIQYGLGDPFTNADRIRAMSDEELAIVMAEYGVDDEKIHFCKNLAECGAILDADGEIAEEKCRGCILEWLRQPVIEVQNNGNKETM